VDGTYRGAEWTAWVKEQYKMRGRGILLKSPLVAD
jgi:hypothetical protein